MFPAGMISVANVWRRNPWWSACVGRLSGTVAVRPVRRWRTPRTGRGLSAPGLTAGQRVTQWQGLLYGQGRHLRRPHGARAPGRWQPRDGVVGKTRNRAAGAGRQESGRVIERGYERAVATVLRRLENEVAETLWSSGCGRCGVPPLRRPARFPHENWLVSSGCSVWTVAGGL